MDITRNRFAIQKFLIHFEVVTCDQIYLLILVKIGPNSILTRCKFYHGILTSTFCHRDIKGWKSSFCYVIHFVVPRRGSGRPTCGALSSAKAYPTRHRVPTNQPKLWGRIAQAHLPTKAAKNQLNCKSY